MTALDRIEQAAEKAKAIELSEGSDAIDFLRSVYRNTLEATPVRMKAAAIAIEYERPRFAVTAIVDGADFEERLKRAIARSGKLIEATAGPPQVEGPIEGPVRKRA